MKHTPRPWTIGEINHKKQRVEIDSFSHDPDLFYTHWTGFVRVYGVEDEPVTGMKKAMANARLIAAAPDLLEALRVLTSHFGKTPSEEVKGLSEARAAIAKATGEA